MSHQHRFVVRRRVMLSLPDTAARFELVSVFACACGAVDVFASWSRTTGRHLTRDELREVQRQERVYGEGKANPDRARKVNRHKEEHTGYECDR